MNVKLRTALVSALCAAVLTLPLGVAAISNAPGTSTLDKSGFAAVISHAVQQWLGITRHSENVAKSPADTQAQDEPGFRWVTPMALDASKTESDVNAKPERADQSQHLLAANGSMAVLPDSRAGLIKNLSLSAHLPQNLRVSDRMIRWEISPLNRPGRTRSVSGHWQQLRLPQGHYAVRLQIGEYQRTRHVHISHHEALRLPFYANIGRIQLRANEQVDWRVHLPHGKILTIPRTATAEPIVETGVYRVEASINDSHHHEMVRVNQGQTVTTRMSIPVGRVNLIAVRNNAPLFQPMHWRIYRLDAGSKREVANYHRHARGIVMPAGRYEAVATFQKTTRSREFWVQKNTHNEVVLAMD